MEQRRFLPSVLALVVLLAVALVIAGIQQPWNGDDDAASPAVPRRSSDVSAELATTIRGLDDAQSRTEFVEAAGDSKAAEQWAQTAWGNLAALDVDEVQLRFLSGGAYVAADGSTSAKVTVSWTPADESILTSNKIGPQTVVFEFDRVDSGRFDVVGTSPAAGPIPLWLAGDLKISAVDGGSVVGIDGSVSATMDTYVTKAYRAVRRTLPQAGSDIVVIVADTEAQAAALLGESTAGIGQLAAITTSLDGTSGAQAVNAIFVNPAIFHAMGDRAAQIVMTHEATHLMTGATGSTAPNWLIEGFADYVALRDDTAPLSVSAGQILRSVKKDGPPAALPSRADFGASAHGLGATYEAAWLIFRMLGERHSVAAIVDFYRSVLDGTPVENALDEQFDLTVQQLTERWQDYLVKSVSTSS